MGKANYRFSLRGISNDPTRQQRRACREDLGPLVGWLQAPTSTAETLRPGRGLGPWRRSPGTRTVAPGPSPAESKPAVRTGLRGSGGSAAEPSVQRGSCPHGSEQLNIFSPSSLRRKQSQLGPELTPHPGPQVSSRTCKSRHGWREQPKSSVLYPVSPPQ